MLSDNHSYSTRHKTTDPELITHQSNLLSSHMRTSKLPSLHKQSQSQYGQPLLQASKATSSHGSGSGSGSVGKSSSSRTETYQHHHPSQYPLSALYALHQASLVVTPTSSISRLQHESSLAGKAISTYSTSSGGLTLKSPSLEQTPAAIDSQQVALSSTRALGSSASTATTTTSERRSSNCSATSSEFSLTSAIPISSLRETDSKQHPSAKRLINGIDEGTLVSLHQSLDRRQQQLKTPRSTTHNRRKDDLDSPSLSTKRSQMKLARKGKGKEARAINRTEPFQEYKGTNSSPACNQGGHVKARLRTITLASHKSTPKSPPPPPPNIRTIEANIPPSPMTPRPLPRIAAMVDAAEDVSIQSSDATLQVVRPPRSMKRSPSPSINRIFNQSGNVLLESPQAQQREEEERRSFDYDGVEWEMLENVKQRQQHCQQQQQQQTPPIHSLTSSEKDNNSGGSNEKWNSIEKWREYAEATIGDAFAKTDEAAQENTTQCDQIFYPNVNGTVPFAPDKVSTGLIPTESFQSMSSMAPSIFYAAMSEAPSTPVTRRSQHRPSTSPHSPSNSVFADTLLATQQFSPDLKVRQFHRPSTAIQHEPSVVTSYPSIDTSASQSIRGPLQTLDQMATALDGCNYMSPSRTSVVSDASEVFQSADEGISSLSPPHILRRSPREHLYRRYHNAQKRASRLFGGRNEFLTSDIQTEKGTLPHPPALHLTTSQLIALSEEAESGLLDTAQWQERSAQLLTTDEDGSPNDNPTSDSAPTPELSRLSATSKEEDSPHTPKSPLWQEEGKHDLARDESQPPQYLKESRSSFEESIFASLQTKSQSDSHLTSPQPPRLIRRKSKRMSAIKVNMEESIQKPSMTFLKLESLPIQLFETPTPSSWRSALSGDEFEDFSKTFGSKEMHRQEVIEELCVTEWNFVIGVSSILRVFTMPLRKSNFTFQDNVPLEVARLFNWLDDILAFHVKMLKSLDKVRSKHPSALIVCVAEALSKHIEGLSIHQSYLVNFEKVTSLLEDLRRSNNKGDLVSFDEMIERQSKLPECRGMALSSFLLKPVQRLMKYPLFFKQLAELTPAEHPDYQETIRLCSLTEKVIRDMNCVKAREEDYQELKLLESKIIGLPEDFHLASRQRRLIKQGPLRSISLSEMDQLMLASPLIGVERSNFSPSPITPPLPHFRPLGLKGSANSSGFSPSPRLGNAAVLLSPDGEGTSPASLLVGSMWSTLPSESTTPTIGAVQPLTNASLQSNASSSPVTTSYFSPDLKMNLAAIPPPRPTSRKASMANLFSRGQMQSKQSDSGVETTLHAFVFDDLLLLTTMHKEEDKEASKSVSKASKKKSASQLKAVSPVLAPSVDDNACYTVVARGGLSRILGVTSKVMKPDFAGSSPSLALEIEVLPISMVGEGLRSSGSSGSLTFVFAFSDESKGSTVTLQEMHLSLWEKAFERSFLSCIQAQRRQTRYAQTDLSSPIFGAINAQRQQGTPTTAQADWLRRRRHVTQMVNNAAKCGDRTTLTALLQAGLPFPRSPSQQNLSDTANRSVAVVERGSSPMLPTYQEPVKELVTKTKVLRKSLSHSRLQVQKKSPILDNSHHSNFSTEEVARIGDLGSSLTSSRILDEERREEKTWWSLRLKEIEVEAERNDELDRIIESRRARVVDPLLPPPPLPPFTETPTLTRVRRGVPVLKSLER